MFVMSIHEVRFEAVRCNRIECLTIALRTVHGTVDPILFVLVVSAIWCGVGMG